jgi:NAD(P)-dependent dehydrogenase (short-subunit alcohol dehydrogenase family)
MTPLEDAVRGRLAGRVALITGASRGIGRGLALRFAREGAQLVLLARTQGALVEIDDQVRAVSGFGATLVPADLTDLDAIDRLGAGLFQRWGRLDILVGNAGTLGRLSPVGHIEPASWDQVLALNLTANWRLIRSCDPLLRASDAGRAIFVTSGVAAGRAYWGAYAVAKGALETLVRTYAHEMARTTVRANLIDPGPTRTGMRAEAYPGEDPNRLKVPDDPRLTDAFVALALPSCESNGETIRVPGKAP